MNIDEIDILYLSFLFSFILFWVSPFILSFIVSKIATRKRKKSFPDEIKKNKEIEKSVYKTTFITTMLVHIALSVIVIIINLISCHPETNPYEGAFVFFPASLTYMIYSFAKANITAGFFTLAYVFINLISTIRKKQKAKKNSADKNAELVKNDEQDRKPSKLHKKIKVIADFIEPISAPFTYILIFSLRSCLSFFRMFYAFTYSYGIILGSGIFVFLGGCMLCYTIPFAYFIYMTARIKAAKDENEKKTLKKKRKSFLLTFILLIIFTTITLLACTSFLPFTLYDTAIYFFEGSDYLISEMYSLPF